MRTCALTVAEAGPNYKVDVSLVIGGSVENKYVLRTTYDSLSVWKAKYAKNISPFYPKLKTNIKDAAIIDNEIWIFAVDATNELHLIDAVKIGASFYKIRPDEIIRNVYVKNLNSEKENNMEVDALIKANMQLYEKSTEAIKKAARFFGITESINFHVFSAAKNHKLPKDNLKDALKSGGAKNITTDKRIHLFLTGSNDGEREAEILTNLYVASI
ncbi:hypothetical protein [Microbulbifer sp. THAF38]|uniref:hypothetical protein n=1 Tax=Microbulbifer sp. THAF38 TaxID=2587856 RepID=UPI001267A505|nr:hypothetical protein [Microbulbifer sp. THAF38]QFT54421.1 hypothetical protein FIU95_07615 [Microbulbifer sp. THAF38]